MHLDSDEWSKNANSKIIETFKTKIIRESQVFGAIAQTRVKKDHRSVLVRFVIQLISQLESDQSRPASQRTIAHRYVTSRGRRGGRAYRWQAESRQTDRQADFSAGGRKTPVYPASIPHTPLSPLSPISTSPAYISNTYLYLPTYQPTNLPTYLPCNPDL